MADELSWLNRFRALLAANAAIDWPDDGLEWLTESGDAVVAFRRASLLCALNVGSTSASFELPPGNWLVRFSSAGARGERAAALDLACPEGILLELVGSSADAKDPEH